MNTLFDDLSRIIASPIPRRQALKLVGGAVGSAVVAALGLGRTSRVWGAVFGSPQALPEQCGRKELCLRGQDACEIGVRLGW